MTHQDIRHLANLASQATAALLPLSADPEGRDSHGGRLANRAEVIERALDTLERAGRLAGHIRRNAGHPGEESGEAQGAPGGAVKRKLSSEAESR